MAFWDSKETKAVNAILGGNMSEKAIQNFSEVFEGDFNAAVSAVSKRIADGPENEIDNVIELVSKVLAEARSEFDTSLQGDHTAIMDKIEASDLVKGSSFRKVTGQIADSGLEGNLESGAVVEKEVAPADLGPEVETRPGTMPSAFKNAEKPEAPKAEELTQEQKSDLSKK